MASVSIRDLPEDVVERLKARARIHGRSLEAELRLILTAAARMTRGELAETADRIAQAAGTQRSDSADLIRRDRDGR